MTTKSPGRLEAALRAGHFVVTAETSPPDSADPDAVLKRAGGLKGLADAVNVLDGAGARAHMSSLAAAAILARSGIEPVLQFTARDRNRLAIQADLIGGAALGIPNILCLHGDDMANGDQPEAKPVYDLDSKGIMSAARDLRDESALPSGRKVEPSPSLFIGGADAPRDPEADFAPTGLVAKIEAGADFFQTQFAFDLASLRRYMARLVDHGVTERAFFIVGIGPLASARSARWMNENLFGVHVPEALISRLEGAADQFAEGRTVCVELLQGLREIEGVHGAHLMGPHAEAAIAEAIRESGVIEGRANAA